MEDQQGLVDRFPILVYDVMEFCIFIRKFAPSFFEVLGMCELCKKLRQFCNNSHSKLGQFC